MGPARILVWILAMGLLQGCAVHGPVATSASRLADDTLKRRLSATEIVQVLRAEGYADVEELGEGGVRFKRQDMTYVLTVYDDGDLQLYFGLTGIDVGTDVVNEWNRTRRLTRAYLDSEQDPVLETDLLSDRGYSGAMLVRWVEVFVQGSGLYHAFLLEHGTLEPFPADAEPASI
jgi:hypothetical protein